MTDETTTSTTSIWILIFAGVATGALSGLLGVGGGIVMVPALAAMGYGRHQANAISLATILVIAVAGTLGFAAGSSVDVAVGLALGLGGVAGATVGARWASRLSGVALARFFGILLLVVGIRMLTAGGSATGVGTLDSPWDLVVGVGVGLAAGIISGLAGVGGGVIMVPAMVFLLGLDQHTAEGTSLLAIIFTAAAGTRVNLSNDYIEWRTVVVLAIAGAACAPLAATFAQSIPADTLARVFAVWLLLIAVRTLVRSRRP